MFKNKNQHKAFSLIEAMIILLLISVAVMVLIPLISVKSDSTRWRELGANNTIFYGQNRMERVGVGNGIDPYTAVSGNNIFAKLRVGTLSFQNNNGQDGLYWSDNYTPANVATPANYNATDRFPEDSIIMGMNTCSNTPDNSIILTSRAQTEFCDDDLIEIGHDGVNINTATNNEVVSIGPIPQDIANPLVDDDDDGNDDITSAIYVSNDFVSLRLPNGSNILTWERGNIGNNGTITLGPVANNGIPTDAATIALGAAGDIYLEDNTYTVLLPDDIPNGCNCTENGCTGSCGDNAECLKSAFVRDADGADGNINYYCGATKKEANEAASATKLWQTRPSDLRLKNVLGEFKKGLQELTKLETYSYTYKSDTKKRIHAGIIAQKLIGIYDEALNKDSKGFYSYDKSPILYSMINAVKEISQKQTDLLKEQKKLNKKADKLIRKYE